MGDFPRKYTRVMSVIFMLCGLAMIIFAVIEAKVVQKDFEFDEFSNILSAFMIISIIIALFMLLLGTFGCCSSGNSPAECCKKCYKWGNCFLFIIFFLLGIVFLLIFYLVADKLKKEDDCADSIIKSINSYSVAANNLFCHEKCPCYIQDTNEFGSGTLDSLSTTTDSSDPTFIWQCDSSMLQQNLANGNYTKLISAMEEKFECSGICQHNPVYVFTDVNQGPPKNKDGCAKEFGSFMQTQGFIIMIICFVISFVLIINMCTVRCIEKKTSYQNEPRKQQYEMSRK